MRADIGFQGLVMSGAQAQSTWLLTIKPFKLGDKLGVAK